MAIRQLLQTTASYLGKYSEIRVKTRNGTRKQGLTYVKEQVCKVSMKVIMELHGKNNRKNLRVQCIPLKPKLYE